jgi:low temperature requirement protein LtrA
VAYTYLHLPIVAGIIVAAVADDLVLADHHASGPSAPLILAGGPLLYLAGVAAFKRASSPRHIAPTSHLVGLVALAGVAGRSMMGDIPLLALHVATTGVLVIVGAWEEVASQQPILALNRRHVD